MHILAGWCPWAAVETGAVSRHPGEGAANSDGRQGRDDRATPTGGTVWFRVKVTVRTLPLPASRLVRMADKTPENGHTGPNYDALMT